MATSAQQMWLNELNLLRAAYVAGKQKPVTLLPSDDGIVKKKRKVVK